MPERSEKSITPVSSPEVMSETRDDLLQVVNVIIMSDCVHIVITIIVIIMLMITMQLQGIRAMDDSIQTLKDEMNKLMSVYEYAKVITNSQ